jgi:hypothetical protein
MRSVEASIEVSSEPRPLIAAFLAHEALASWWGVERSFVEPRVGGTFAVAWKITDAGFGFVTTGVIGALDLDHALRIDSYTYFHPERPIFGGMTLHVEARRAGSGSVLRVRQDGYRDGPDWDWYHDAVTSAWPKVVQEVKRYVEAPHG